MKLIVNAHKIELIPEEPVNEKEINISKCKFEFSDEYGDNLVKEAYFTLDGETYKQIIVNDECSYPPEVLVKIGTVELGVVAYEVQDEEYIERFNPSPVYFQTTIGSLKDHAENSEEITPSEMEQFEQALEEGLAEVANVDIDASKSGNTATVSITNRNGITKIVEIYDGEKGEDGEPGITPNIQVGTTTTLPAGSNATVNQRGTTENPIFDFGIPKGQDGQSGGVSDYTELSNKPKINNVELVGNKTTSDLGIVIPDISTKQDKITTTNKLSSDLVDDTDKTNKFVTASDKTTWNSKQDALVSGTNIKTINNTSILGSGDITISSSTPKYYVDGSYLVYNLSPGYYNITSPTASWVTINNLPSTEMSEALTLAYTNDKYLALNIPTTTVGQTTILYASSKVAYGIGLGLTLNGIIITSEGDICGIGLNVVYDSTQTTATYSTGKIKATGTYSLGTGNTKAYTPTQTTHPATKGYVDDAIAGASTSVDIDGSSITKNSDDELQTVGIIDNNSGNTDKIWTGTLAQYNDLATKDSDTFYYITDDDATSTLRQKVEVITSSNTSYTIANLTANKSYKLSELTALTITACETFDEESVIYFDSGNTATVLSLPNDVVQIGDTTIEANKSYIISILNKIAIIKAYEVS